MKKDQKEIKINDKISAKNWILRKLPSELGQLEIPIIDDSILDH